VATVSNNFENQNCRSTVSSDIDGNGNLENFQIVTINWQQWWMAAATADRRKVRKQSLMG